MSNTKNTKSKRVAYGFILDFPDEFTMRELRKSKDHKISYISLYKRVRGALAAGTIVVAGKKTPDQTRKGRRQLVYKRVLVGSSESAVA